jgi:putative ABC transport system substrate-binding protein
VAPTGGSRQCSGGPQWKAKRTVGERRRHRRTDPFQKAGLSGYDASFWPAGTSMRRRQFITLLGGAAAWPVAARAQQPNRMKRVGVLTQFFESDPESRSWVSAFVQRLGELGWADGPKIQIVYRWAGDDAVRMRAFAAELVAMQPDAILAGGTPSAMALWQSTRSVPVVFVQVSGDPVEIGFVVSIARPDGNMTGFTQYEVGLAGKWLEILKEMFPGIEQVAMIFDPINPAVIYYAREIEQAASSFGVLLTRASVSNPTDIERGIATVARNSNVGLIVLPSPATLIHRELIVRLAAQYRLPSVYPFRYFAATGGLASYGVDPADLYRRGASYVDRILRGEKPGDLPVQAPTKFEFVINMKTAKGLGLTFPLSLLGRADEVIE